MALNARWNLWTALGCLCDKWPVSLSRFRSAPWDGVQIIYVTSFLPSLSTYLARDGVIRDGVIYCNLLYFKIVESVPRMHQHESSQCSINITDILPDCHGPSGILKTVMASWQIPAHAKVQSVPRGWKEGIREPLDSSYSGVESQRKAVRMNPARGGYENQPMAIMITRCTPSEHLKACKDLKAA
ncbi:hypothetical protein FB451DRAFT_1188891 [Mycena latifolia]|nr:hypothetical protein FB451DRAFT_1188891 [Mycena latifolia]